MLGGTQEAPATPVETNFFIFCFWTFGVYEVQAIRCSVHDDNWDKRQALGWITAGLEIARGGKFRVGAAGSLAPPKMHR